MDSNFQSLPPLKRFRLLQQELKKQQQELPPLFQSESESNLKAEVEKRKPLPLSPSSLPSKKRKQSRDFFFDQKERKENQPPVEAPTQSLILPAKKRMQSRGPVIDPDEGKENLPPITPPVSYCLPAKKRIWAFRPDFSPIKNAPTPFFDLNLEYNPSLELTGQDEFGSKNEEAEGGDDVGLKDSPFQIEIESKDEEIQGRGDVDDAEVEDDGILCAVCESTDGDESDPIVFCDGCDLMVHSNCYGNPLINGIPEGEWFCHQCLKSQALADKDNSHKCCLCPDSGGAMKPTTDGRWAHIVCAVLVPEVFFEDPEGRDGIDCSMIPKRRWKEKCYVCKERKGCAIECSEPKCGLAFHVTCGLKQDLSIELKQGRKNNGGIVAGFCKKHTELWKKQQQTGKFKIVARGEDK